MLWDIIYLLGAMVIQIIVCVGTVFVAFYNRTRRTKKQILLTAAGALAIIVAMQSIYMNLLDVRYEWIYALVVISLVVVYCKYVFRCKLEELMFVFFVFKSYMDCLFSFTKIIQVYVIGRAFQLSETISFSIAYMMVFLLTVYPMWRFSRNLLCPLVDKTENMRFWKVVWFIPFFYYLVYKMGVSPLYRSPEQIMDYTPVILPLIWTGASFGTIAIMIRMMLEVSQVVEEREKRNALERQLTLQLEQYKNIQKSVEYARKLDHDLRHHFLAISGYTENGDLEGLQNYLKLYMDSLLPREPVVVCDNYAVNAILQHFMSRADRDDIEIQVKVDISNECKISESDLCIIIGNLLENAMEACEAQTGGHRYVNIKCVSAGEQRLVIIVENTYSHVIKKRSEVFQSTKRSGDGIGITSVKEMAGKYNGIVNFMYSQGIFKVSVLLNL